jgi:sugar phosphate isomerase/epimerase
MVFGYSTNAYVKHPLLETIDRIARLGFGGVEIICDEPHLYPPDYNKKRLRDLKDAIGKNRLRVTNLNSFTLFAVGDTYLPSWIEPDAERRDIRIHHTLDCLDLAEVLDCGNISVPPGGPLMGMSRDRAFALFYKGLEKVIPRAEELGVKVLIEPEPKLLMENTREFLSFIKHVRSDAVGINFDVGHFFCAGEDPCIAFEKLCRWVGHVHLEDIGADRSHNHLIAGRGAIDFADVFETFKRFGYTGDISLELYPYVDIPDEAGQKSLEFLKPIFTASGLDINEWNLNHESTLF